MLIQLIFHSNFRYDAVGAMRAMEKFTQEVGGYPFLYADIFMTREEFEEMFDLTGNSFLTVSQIEEWSLENCSKIEIALYFQKMAFRMEKCSKID